ncbi:hypothetical protein BSLG_005646 [Batrachochytrium salamandrivorans]|nr:hypothetical protein BSLG_005646 [Batrachochytrium salamandrivorans]
MPDSLFDSSFDSSFGARHDALTRLHDLNDRLGNNMVRFTTASPLVMDSLSDVKSGMKPSCAGINAVSTCQENAIKSDVSCGEDKSAAVDRANAVRGFIRGIALQNLHCWTVHHLILNSNTKVAKNTATAATSCL